MLTIAWDVDDVLNNLMEEWLKDYSIKNEKQIPYSSIKENPPSEILGISLNEYFKSLDKFRLSEASLNMAPNSEILNWFEQNGGYFKNIALSATTQFTSQNGAFWVMKHFSKWISSYNIVPSYRDGENYTRQFETKKDFLNWIKVVNILVDDNEKNIQQAEELGIKGFLVSRPWNTGGLTITEILAELNKLRGE